MQRVCCACAVRGRWLVTVVQASWDFQGICYVVWFFLLRSKTDAFADGDQLIVHLYSFTDPVRNYYDFRSLHVPIASLPVVPITSTLVVHAPLMNPMAVPYGIPPMHVNKHKIHV